MPGVVPIACRQVLMFFAMFFSISIKIECTLHTIVQNDVSHVIHKENRTKTINFMSTGLLKIGIESISRGYKALR